MFEPMSSNLVVQVRSALSEESKVSSLAEEFLRRLKNTSIAARRVVIAEGLCTKKRNSGHTEKFIKKVTLKGIRNYMAK